MVEGDPQQEEWVIEPQPTIQAMKAIQEEYSGEERRSVPATCRCGPPHQPAGGEADDGLENGGFPSNALRRRETEAWPRPDQGSRPNAGSEADESAAPLRTRRRK